MRRAFTLIELLIVLAIVALLAALLFPAFATARSMARRASCTSQMRQIGMGMAMYRQDFDAWPRHLTIIDPTYTNSSQIFVCPNDADNGQRIGTDFLEGSNYLPDGESYEYWPQWQYSVTNGWYQPAPDFGAGKWDDMTPLVGCPWHWAKKFDAEQDGNLAGSKGWEMILTSGGSVRKIRVEGLMNFSPDNYQ